MLFGRQFPAFATRFFKIFLRKILKRAQTKAQSGARFRFLSAFYFN